MASRCFFLEIGEYFNEDDLLSFYMQCKEEEEKRLALKADANAAGENIDLHVKPPGNIVRKSKKPMSGNLGLKVYPSSPSIVFANRSGSTVPHPSQNTDITEHDEKPLATPNLLCDDPSIILRKHEVEKQGPSIDLRKHETEKQDTSIDFRKHTTKKQDPSIDLRKQETKKQDPSIGITNHENKKQDPSIYLRNHEAENQNSSIDFSKQETEKQYPPIDIRKHATDKQDPPIDIRKHATDKQDPPIDIRKHLSKKQDPSIDLSEHETEKRDPSIDLIKHDAEKQDPSIDLRKNETKKQDTSVDFTKQDAEKQGPPIDLRKHGTEKQDPPTVIKKHEAEKQTIYHMKNETEKQDPSIDLRHHETEKQDKSIEIRKHETEIKDPSIDSRKHETEKQTIDHRKHETEKQDPSTVLRKHVQKKKTTSIELKKHEKKEQDPSIDLKTRGTQKQDPVFDLNKQKTNKQILSIGFQKSESKTRYPSIGFQKRESEKQNFSIGLKKQETENHYSSIGLTKHETEKQDPSNDLKKHTTQDPFIDLNKHATKKQDQSLKFFRVVNKVDRSENKYKILFYVFLYAPFLCCLFCPMFASALPLRMDVSTCKKGLPVSIPLQLSPDNDHTVSIGGIEVGACDMVSSMTCFITHTLGRGYNFNGNALKWNLTISQVSCDDFNVTVRITGQQNVQSTHLNILGCETQELHDRSPDPAGNMTIVLCKIGKPVIINLPLDKGNDYFIFYGDIEIGACDMMLSHTCFLTSRAYLGKFNFSGESILWNLTINEMLFNSINVSVVDTGPKPTHNFTFRIQKCKLQDILKSVDNFNFARGLFVLLCIIAAFTLLICCTVRIFE